MGGPDGDEMFACAITRHPLRNTDQTPVVAL